MLGGVRSGVEGNDLFAAGATVGVGVIEEALGVEFEEFWKATESFSSLGAVTS